MTNRIPLIVNAGAAQIQELASSDNLIVAANVITGGIKTDGYYYANGTPVTFSGSNTGNIGFDNYNIYNTQGDGVIISNFNFVTAEAETAYVQIPAGNSSADLNIVQEQGNVRLVANTVSWNFDTTGNLSVPVNINFNGGGIYQTLNEDFYTRVSDNEDEGWTLFNVVDDGAGTVFTQTELDNSGFVIRTDVAGSNYQWNFDNQGRLNLPGNINGIYGGNTSFYAYDNGSGGSVELKTISYAGDALGSNVRVSQSNATISTSSGSYTWKFDSNGVLTLPGQSAQINTINSGWAFSETIIDITYNTPAVITISANVFPGPVTGQVTIAGVNPPVQANGTWYYEAVDSNQFALYTDAELTQPVNPSSWPGYVDGGTAVCLGGHDLVVSAGNINFSTGQNGNESTWAFGSDGNLTLPSNTFAVNYANGTPVSLGGGSNTGNVTFDNVTVQGDNSSLNLSAGPSFTADLAYLQVRSGDVASHIHLDTGNNVAYDQYFGNDNKYLKLEQGIAGNVLIGTYQDGGVGQLTWTFDRDGNLTVPGSIKASPTGFFAFESSIANISTGTTTVIVDLADSPFTGPSSGQVLITNVNGTTQANGAWYWIAVEANQIQLYEDSGFSTPVNGTTWTAYISGGLATSPGANNLTLVGGNVVINNTLNDNWTFNAAGYLVKPNDVVENTTNTIDCPAGAPTVIYTSTGGYQHTLKLLIQVEGLEGGLSWDTQSCEMVVAKSFRNNNVVGTVYGLAYTSTNPLATFNAVWNASLFRVQITCTPTSLTYGVATRVCVTEIVTSD